MSGSLRIRGGGVRGRGNVGLQGGGSAPVAVGGASLAAPAGGTIVAAPRFDSYLARLLKLIPVEVLGFVLVSEPLVPAGQTAARVAVFVLGLLGVFLIRTRATRGDDGRPQWPAVWISAGSYLVWVYQLGGAFAELGLHVPWAGSLLVVVWTFLVPLVYRGDPT